MQVLDFAYNAVVFGSIAYIATSFVRYAAQRSQSSSMARKCAAAVQDSQDSIAAVLDQWVEPIEMSDDALPVVEMDEPTEDVIVPTEASVAIEDVVVPFRRRPKAEAIDWNKLTPQQLRQECQSRGIKWRNYHGRNKHLNKAGMIAALNAIAAA